MLLLATGLLVFFLIHLVPGQPDLRGALVGRLGERGYKAAFAALSLIGLALIVVGFGKLQATPGKNPQIWAPPLWTRHVALLLMIPSMILLVAAYVPSRIRTAVRHPMLAAIKVWALAHLLANGDLASLLLFGSFLAFAIYDRMSVARRSALGPLGSKAGTASGDVVAIVAGLGLYAAILMWGHARLIGVPLLPRWT